MIDTEIIVNRKCVGKYDLCKDRPMFDLDYVVRVGSKMNTYTRINVDLQNIAQINECYKRNMHVALTLLNVSFGIVLSSNFVNIKFPRIKDTMTSMTPSGDAILICGTYAPIASDTIIECTLRFDLDDNEYSKGNIKINNGKLYFNYPNALLENITESDYDKVVVEAYASLF